MDNVSGKGIGGNDMKTYQRPELYYESFELSQHIAGGCDVVVNAALTDGADGCSGKGVTGTPWDGFENVFVSGDVDCKIGMNGYCYQTSSVSVNTVAFNS